MQMTGNTPGLTQLILRSCQSRIPLHQSTTHHNLQVQHQLLLLLLPSLAITIKTPSIDSDRGTPHSSIRPWTDAEDHELCTMKNDSKSRPSWKTIGLRLRRDPEVCRIRWGILKQMPEHTSLTEPEAEE